MPSVRPRRFKGSADPGATHELALSCIVCDDRKMCSTPEQRFTLVKINARVQSGARLDSTINVAAQVSKLLRSCTWQSPARTVTRDQLRSMHLSLMGLNGLPPPIEDVDLKHR